MKRFILAGLASAALLSAIPATPAISATLIVDASGKLTGATDVSVLGTVYDVVFLDGTCASVFNGCDDHEDFAFSNSRDAPLAALALLDQVLVSSFDDSPALTSGCTDPLRCSVWIPFHVNTGFSIDVAVADNWYPGEVDRALRGTFRLSDVPDFSPSGEDRLVWAKFTRPVPEPSTWTMMLLGFALSGSLLRRSRRAISSDLN
jgi:hypothetical protein